MNPKSDELQNTKKKRLLPPGELALFFEQLTMMLQGGITLDKGLRVLCGNAESGVFSGTFITHLADHVGDGGTLTSAMKGAGVFPEYVLYMTEIGEETGRLDSVLAALGDYYRKEHSRKIKLRNALMYPVFLIVIMSAVIVLLVGQVFPIFSGMLESMGGSLSDAENAAAAFAGSLTAGKYTMYIFLALAVIAMLLFVFSRTRPGRDMLNKFAGVFPLTKKINSKIAASRFSDAISMTLSSGMDIGSVMNFAVGLAGGNAREGAYGEVYNKCAEEIKSGVRFSDAAAKTGFFTPVQMSFIEIGEKTGGMDAAMRKVSDSCAEEAETVINRVSAIIEPLMVGVLSVIIGAVLVSVMIPLIEIMSNIT